MPRKKKKTTLATVDLSVVYLSRQVQDLSKKVDTLLSLSKPLAEREADEMKKKVAYNEFLTSKYHERLVGVCRDIKRIVDATYVDFRKQEQPGQTL